MPALNVGSCEYLRTLNENKLSLAGPLLKSTYADKERTRTSLLFAHVQCSKFSADLATEQVDETYARHS